MPLNDYVKWRMLLRNLEIFQFAEWNLVDFSPKNAYKPFTNRTQLLKFAAKLFKLFILAAQNAPISDYVFSRHHSHYLFALILYSIFVLCLLWLSKV